MPDRQLGLSEALRRRVAHHRNRRGVRRSRRFRQTAGVIRAADALGSGTGCNSTGRTSGNVRLDDEELPSGTRRAEWSDGGAAGFEKLHELRTEPRSEIWMG